MADLDGDGKTELVTTKVGPEALPVVEAMTPALGDKRLWRTTLPGTKPARGCPTDEPLISARFI